MAYKFLTEADFGYKIRNEILTILKGADPDNLVTPEKAELLAISQIIHYIGTRYDMVTVFNATGQNRDAYMIDVVLTIIMYKMYSGRTGMKDIPSHRKEEYDDVLEWLRSVRDGKPAALPSLISDEQPGEVRINSMDQKDWEY
jgi:hypothetical protein